MKKCKIFLRSKPPSQKVLNKVRDIIHGPSRMICFTGFSKEERHAVRKLVKSNNKHVVFARRR